eukprot:2462369-Amphidinium_carterae.1
MPSPTEETVNSKLSHKLRLQVFKDCPWAGLPFGLNYLKGSVCSELLLQQGCRTTCIHNF